MKVNKTQIRRAMLCIVPYDAGDRISFRYIEVPDFQKVAHEIERSKEVLASSDYKIKSNATKPP